MLEQTNPDELGMGQLQNTGGVTIRSFPWPYKAMLAICSDIDTETPRHFALLHRFLNTRETTPLGQGLGLDIADSFWFYTRQTGRPPEYSQMSFFSGMHWQKRSPCAEQILDYVRGGWIDTLHSFGNFSYAPAGDPDRFTREHAVRALDVIAEADLSIKVWSDHGNHNNIQNLGSGGEHLAGDMPGHPCRHSDLTVNSGMRFVWSSARPDAFQRDAAVVASELRDGLKIWRFSRQTCANFADPKHADELARRFGAKISHRHRGAIAMVWHPQLLHVQLSPGNLGELAEKGGYAIVGQHLGRVNSDKLILPKEAVDSLRRLKSAQDAGNILVARTSRLLEYAVTRDGLRYETARDASGKTVIDLAGIDDLVRGAQAPDLDRLRGITFEVPGDGPVELRLRGQPVTAQEIGQHRLANKCFIGIRWFPPDHTDYTDR